MSRRPVRQDNLSWEHGAGPALPVAEEKVRGLVQDLMVREGRTSATWPIRRSPVPARTPGAGWRRHRVLLVAAALVAAGAFAALSSRKGAPPPPAPATATPAIAISAVPPPVHPPTEPLPPAEPNAPPLTPEPPERTRLPPPSPNALPETVEDLLQQANSLRRQTKWQEAARTYERAIAIVPGSRKAYVATAAAASIHLEHLGDPRGALALYQSALRMQPSGVLSEEVRWGIAQSYRALGDRSGEVAALRAFLASHPDSLLRVRAESRLAELE